MAAQTYSPSGKSGPDANVLGLLCSAVLLPASWAYAWATTRLSGPSVCIALAIASIALALVANRLCRWGKVRNPARMGWAGLELGLIFWYSHWAAWVALSGREWSTVLPMYIDLLCSPLELWKAIGQLRHASNAAAGSEPFSAAWAITFWLVELCCLILAPRAAGVAAAKAVFCERSGSWAVEFRISDEFEPIADEAAFLRQVELQPHLAVLSLVRRAGEGQGDHASVTLYACAGGDCYISIDNNVRAWTPDDAEVYWASTVVERLQLRGVRAEELLRHWVIPLPEVLATTCDSIEPAASN